MADGKFQWSCESNESGTFFLNLNTPNIGEVLKEKAANEHLSACGCEKPLNYVAIS